MTDATRKQIERAASLCTGCPKMCRFSCPVAVADGRESSTPTAKMTTASLLVRGRIELTAEAAEPLYRCTGCQLQQSFCKHGVDVPDVLEAARVYAYERGALPAPLTAKEARLRVDRDPLASELARLARTLENGVTGPDLVLHGCRTLRDDLAGARRELALVEHATGRRPATWSRDPICCGYPLHALGDRAALTRQAKAFAKSARDAGRVVAADPACAFTLRRVYSELGIKLRPTVVTLPELLHAERARLPTAPATGESVVYHDPCHLGRRLGVYDEPRLLLAQAGARLLSPPWDRELARCCGFGAAYPMLDPTNARAIARTRRDELVATGASRIVTACPTCKVALGTAGEQPVESLTEVIARSIGIS